MRGYLSLDIVCSSKLTVFLEFRSRKTVRFLEQIMSADKYRTYFSAKWRLLFGMLDVIVEANGWIYSHFIEIKSALNDSTVLFF